ncbi:MAG: EamA/RhaT family transporter [Bacteroidetes bacterium]|nr:EamA/RhaT family transporter [Bacteroidota bacterium]
MIYLLLTILLNTFLFILFKLFPRFGIDALQAIVVNYITCVVTGSIFLGYFPISKASTQQPWFGWALFLGLLFISIFNFIAYCTRKYGMTISTIANKLSIVIPVVFSVLLYNEHLTALNIAGLLIAFPAVYLSARVEGESGKVGNLLIPALLFISCGALDTFMKYTEHTYLQSKSVQAVFPVHVFAVAALIGITVVTILVLQKKSKPAIKNVVAGMILGVPNYFSIYYYIRLLNSDFMKSSASIPVNNIGIVLCCAFAAILLFKEPSTKTRMAGLALSVIAIILISLN